MSAESVENQIVLTGCSCDWQGIVATRSVGHTRSVGREITGNKTVTCPTDQHASMLQMCPATVSDSSRPDLTRESLITF